MERSLRLTVVTVGIFLLTLLRIDQAHGQESAQPAWDPAAAAKYLDGRADWWLKWSSSARGQGTACISCHTTLPFALARGSLGTKLGETETSEIEKRLIANLNKRVDNWEKIVAEPTGKNPFVPFYAGQRKPSALGTEAVINALVLVNHDTRRAKGVLSAPSRKALGHLWGQQQENGAWLWLDFGLNPWETDGAYYGASLAALAVGMAGKDYYAQADVQPKVAALKKYLNTQLASQRLHHRAVALWASSRLPGMMSDQDKKKLVEELLNAQAADGGWSLPTLGKNAAKKGDWTSKDAFPKGTVSDGYATGLVVLALKGALPAEDARLQKGLRWLAAQQQEGTWGTNYLNKSRDPASDVGKFMRDAATAFAVLALTD